MATENKKQSGNNDLGYKPGAVGDSITLIILHLLTGYFVIAARIHYRWSDAGRDCRELIVHSDGGYRQQVQTGESGGIGRRTGFRFQRRKVWGFESPLSHH